LFSKSVHKKFSDFAIPIYEKQSLQDCDNWHPKCSFYQAEERPMEYRKKLITGLIGLAMLATPIAAAAKDLGSRSDNNNAPISRTYDMPTHPDSWTSSPIVLVDDWREDRYERNHRWGNDGWRYRRGYGYNRGYYRYGNRGYYMPRNYAGGSCGWAQHLRRVYNQDRWSGHPAAAEDLLPRLRRAERACGGGSYGYNRWHRYY